MGSSRWAAAFLSSITFWGMSCGGEAPAPTEGATPRAATEESAAAARSELGEDKISDGTTTTEIYVAPKGDTVTALAVNDKDVFVGVTGTFSVAKIGLKDDKAETLASSPYEVTAITLDSASVYWSATLSTPLKKGGYTYETAILSVPLAGGTVTTLAAGAGYDPSGLALTATDLYWADANLNAVLAVPLGGGAVSTFSSGQDIPCTLAADATDLYWTTCGSYAVVSQPLAGGKPKTLGTNFQQPDSMVQAGPNVYVAALGGLGSPSGVFAVPKAGGSPTTLFPYSSLFLATDSTNLYFDYIGDQATLSVPVGGGTPVTLSTGYVHPFFNSVNSKSVFFNSRRKVYQVTPK